MLINFLQQQGFDSSGGDEEWAELLEFSRYCSEAITAHALLKQT